MPSGFLSGDLVQEVNRLNQLFKLVGFFYFVLFLLNKRYNFTPLFLSHPLKVKLYFDIDASTFISMNESVNWRRYYFNFI